GPRRRRGAGGGTPARLASLAREVQVPVLGTDRRRSLLYAACLECREDRWAMAFRGRHLCLAPLSREGQDDRRTREERLVPGRGRGTAADSFAARGEVAGRRESADQGGT